MISSLVLGFLSVAPHGFTQEATLLQVDAGTQLDEVVLAIETARRQAPERDVVVELAGGTYSLSRPLVLGPEACGDELRTVRWRAAPGESVTLSGGQVVAEWQLEADGTWSAPAPEGTVRQLFVDGARRPRARWPREGWLRVETPGDDGRTWFTYAENDVFAWPDVEGADLVFLHDWSMSRVRVAKIEESERRLQLAQPIGGYLPFFHITGFEAHPRYAFENLRSAWENPGEWYLDSGAGRIRYRPLPDEQLARTQAVIPMCERLLEIRGEPGRPVRGVTLQGIRFADTRSMDPVGGYAGIQAAFHDGRADSSEARELPPSCAVRVTYAEGVVFEDCRFERLGASGLWMGAGVRDSRVARSTFTDVGACGLMIGEAEEPEQDSGLTSRVVCEDSTFEHCGVLCYGAVGIWVGIAEYVTVRHNELRHLPYTGVSLGWIWSPRPSPSRGHVIERNHIHHVMQTLSDGGGVYTLGLQPDTYVRHNLIHDVPVNAGRAGSNGFFIDQGSSAIAFEDNVIYSVARSPIRFHMAGSNTLARNVLVTPPETPAFRYDACTEDLMTFDANRVVPPEGWTPPAADALEVGPR